MTNQLFEQAKQAVAEKRNCEDWGFMMAAYEGVEAFMPEGWLSETVNGAWQEASELYAQWRANEAVKADRATIRSTCLSSMPKLDKSGETEGYYWIFDGQKFQELEIPFPQQPDGI